MFFPPTFALHLFRNFLIFPTFCQKHPLLEHSRYLWIFIKQGDLQRFWWNRTSCRFEEDTWSSKLEQLENSVINASSIAVSAIQRDELTVVLVFQLPLHVSRLLQEHERLSEMSSLERERCVQLGCEVDKCGHRVPFPLCAASTGRLITAFHCYPRSPHILLLAHCFLLWRQGSRNVKSYHRVDH